MTPERIAHMKKANRNMLRALKQAQNFIIAERTQRETGGFKRSDPYLAVPSKLAILIAVTIVHAERKT